VYGGFPFGVAVSPQELLRHREEYATHLNREAFGLCWIVHLQIVFCDLQRIDWTLLACVSLLGVKFFR
jgi:hypothetical protein